MSKQRVNWDDIFSRYKASGLTQPAFCKQADVPFNKFQYRWSKRIQAAKVSAEAKATRNRKSVENSFEPIIISSSPVAVAQPGSNIIELVVHLPNKIRCEIKIDSCVNEFSILLKQLVALC